MTVVVAKVPSGLTIETVVRFSAAIGREFPGALIRPCEGFAFEVIIDPDVQPRDESRAATAR